MQPPIAPVLPYVQLRWNAPSLIGEFVCFYVYRRVAGDVDWTRLAIISDITALSYRDYTATSRVLYEYAVTQLETIGLDLLESEFPATQVFEMLIFDWAYLHQVGDPRYYVPLFAFDISEQIVQDVEWRSAWGRRQPSAFVGDEDYSALQLTGLPDRARGDVWRMLREVVSRQPDAAAVYCLRIGADGRRWFVNLEQSSRRMAQGSSDASVSMREVYYVEGPPAVDAAEGGGGGGGEEDEGSFDESFDESFA